MGSALYDTAAIKHENLVCVHDSGKPVRDYDASTVEHQSLQRFLDESLRTHVHARRRFIQNQNWRILQECPRNRKPLLSPTLNFTPRSPTTLLNPCGNRSMNARAFATAAASRSSSSVAPGFPICRFSRMVPLNKKHSCVAIPICCRNARILKSRIGLPSTKISPLSNS